MPRPVDQAAKLRKLIKIAEDLLLVIEQERRTKAAPKASAAPVRRRRSGKELVAFRKTLKAERKRGVPVAEIARKHGVSSAYIYQL